MIFGFGPVYCWRCHSPLLKHSYGSDSYRRKLLISHWRSTHPDKIFIVKSNLPEIELI